MWHHPLCLTDSHIDVIDAGYWCITYKGHHTLNYSISLQIKLIMHLRKLLLPLATLAAHFYLSPRFYNLVCETFLSDSQYTKIHFRSFSIPWGRGSVLFILLISMPKYTTFDHCMDKPRRLEQVKQWKYIRKGTEL